MVGTLVWGLGVEGGDLDIYVRQSIRISVFIHMSQWVHVNISENQGMLF